MYARAAKGSSNLSSRNTFMGGAESTGLEHPGSRELLDTCVPAGFSVAGWLPPLASSDIFVWLDSLSIATCVRGLPITKDVLDLRGP